MQGTIPKLKEVKDQENFWNNWRPTTTTTNDMESTARMEYSRRLEKNDLDMPTVVKNVGKVFTDDDKVES